MKISLKFIELRLFTIAILVAGLFVCNFMSLTLAQIVGIFFFLYIMTIVFFAAFFGNLKRLVTSIETIYVTVYFVYAVMNAVQYLLDNGSQRMWYFTVTDTIMVATLTIYLNIFIIFILLLLLTGYPKKNTFENVAASLKESNLKISANFNAFDIIAFGCFLIFFFMFIRNIPNVFSFISLRRVMRFSGQQYIWLYMMAYSISFLSGIPFERHYLFKKNNLIRTLIIVGFWALSILIDRRHIVPVIMAVALLILATKRDVKLRTLIPFAIIIVGLLVLAVIRLGYSMDSLPVSTLIYTMFGEFILTNYVSCYYVAMPPATLMRGSTYIWNTITKLIPRAIYAGKPLDLAQVFYNQVIKSGSGFAFNPVAEGLINFGTLSVITTPLIIYFVMRLGARVYKKEPLFYLMICAYSFDFFRGEFANSMFDILVLYICLHFMSRLNKREVEHSEGISYAKN